MSAPSDKHAELCELLEKLIDGELNSGEAKRLNELLRADPSACDLYLNHITLHAQLERELGGKLSAADALGSSAAAWAPAEGAAFNAYLAEVGAAYAARFPVDYLATNGSNASAAATT